MKNFVPIPSDFYRRPEINRMIMREHCSGLGAYVMIITYLRECESYRAFANAEEIAFATGIVDIDLCRRIMTKYSLFKREDEDFFYSPWLREIMTVYEETREKRRKAGQASAEARRAATLERHEGERTGEQVLEQVLNTCSPCVATKNPDASTINKQINITEQINQPNNKHDVGGVGAVGGSVVIGDFEIKRDLLESVCREKGSGPSTKVMRYIADKEDEGHNTDAIIDICTRFKLSDNQAKIVAGITNFGEIGKQEFIDIMAMERNYIKRPIDVKYPLNYILSKISSYGK